MILANRKRSNPIALRGRAWRRALYRHLAWLRTADGRRGLDEAVRMMLSEIAALLAERFLRSAFGEQERAA